MSDSASSKKPVTMRHIADELGISVAAVSMALRNGSQVSAQLKVKVKEVAQRMGWKPNPLLAAYQAQVRALKPTGFQATLGWLNDHFEKDHWDTPWDRPLFEGAKIRANELGFALDSIWIPDRKPDDYEGNAKKYRRILLSRGIHGVILPNLYRPQHAALPWADFAVVCIGRQHVNVEKSDSQRSRKFHHHMVTFDAYSNTRLALDKLRAAGCRRIGLAISIYEDHATDGICSAAYLRAASEWPKKEQVPILFSDQAPEVGRWIKRYSPDAVLCMYGEMKRNIEMAGCKVPGEVRLAHLNLATDVQGWSGVDRRLDQIGSAAVDLVSAHAIRNDRGVPYCAKEVLIEGIWVDGTT